MTTLTGASAVETRSGRVVFARLVSAALLVISLLLLPTLATGQPEPGQPEPGSTIRVATNLVTLNITVDDQVHQEMSGKALPKLGIENFVVFEDGIRQEIAGFSSTEMPFNLVLLIDTSGSTRADLDLIQRGARRFFDALRVDDRLAIVQFNRQVEMLRDLTADREKLEQGLRLLDRGTGTSFYDAIKLTVEDILGAVRGRKVIVVLTDGVDSYGYLTWENIRAVVEKAGATIHVLRLDTELFTRNGIRKDCRDSGRFEFSAKQLRKYYDEYVKSGPRSPYESHCRLSETTRLDINRRLYESARIELEQLARLTGGSVSDIGQLSQLEAAYLRVANSLTNVYSISYYPKNDQRDGRWRALRVEVKIASRPGLVATTRPGYRAGGD